MGTLSSSVIEDSENISIIWENLKLSFRICLGVIKSYYKTRRCVDMKQDTLKYAWFPHEVCVKSRDWWWRDAGDLFVSPDFGIWQLPSSLALVAHVLVTFLGPPSPPGAHKQQLQMRSFSLGSNLQNRMFLRLKKTSKENRVISRKHLFRENMTLSML